MGGMFDTKTDKLKRKQELTQKEQKEKRKKSIITVTVTVVFLLAVAVSILLNSNWLRRTLPVITIDGVSLSTAEFEYFYNSEFMRFASELENQGLSYMLPDQNIPFSKQIYNPETGQSWADFIIEITTSRLQSTIAIYNIAVSKGFELSQERLAELDEMLAMEEFQAQMYGFPSLNSYLQRVYGAGMTSEIYLELQKMAAMADDYAISVRDSFIYTDAQIDEHYAENADLFDIFRYRVFVVEAEEPDEIGDDIEAALALSREAALEKAEAYAAEIVSEEDFIAAALVYNEGYYANPDNSLVETQGVNTNNIDSLDFYFSSWLLDDNRQYGDITVVDTHLGAAVLFYLSREDNYYPTVNMRQILILRDNISPSDYLEGEDDPEYIAAVEQAENDAATRAELVNTLFLEAGATEQALLDLMEEHSDETTEGGYYEKIAKTSYQSPELTIMKVIPEMEAWLFDNRTVGDAELIESEAYGFHLTYFAGYGDIFARLIAQDDMRNVDINDWYDNLVKAEPVRHRAFIFVTT